MNLFNKNKHLPAFVLLSSVCFGQYQFEVKNASKSYDAVIQVENCYDGQCNGRGTVDLFDHRNTKVQTFVSDNLVLNLNQGEKPVLGKIFQLKKENGPMVIDDFNFDGT